MLQALRNNLKGWVAIVAVAIIGIPVLFFGIQDYFSSRVPTWVAKVGEVEIQPEEFRERWFEYTREMRRIFGDSYDAAMIETPVARRQLLERMIDEQVLFQYGTEAGVSVSDALLGEEIGKIAAFQNNGVFDPTQYQLRLAANNLSPAAFETRFRRELTSSFLPRKVADSSFVSPASVDRFLALDGQLRDFRFVRIPQLSPPTEEPEAATLETWFAANEERFRSEEQVELEYFEIDVARVEPAADPDEAALKARYESQKERFVTAEQRLASHILVRVAPDADAEAVKAAQDKAAGLTGEARGGADFAELARANSDDLGSKSEGGDLGWIEAGLMQPGFEEALFAMEPGTISDPVKTDEGFHVIQLREVRAGSARSFEEVREELLAEARAGARETAYNDVVGRTVDQMLNDPSDMKAAAAVGGFEIRRVGPFGRLGAGGIAALPDVQRFAFSEVAISVRGISDPIEVGPNHVVFVRVVDHKPSAPQTLDQVRDQALAGFRAEESVRRSEERAKQLEGRLKAGETLDVLAAELGATVESSTGAGRRSLDVDRAILDQAFLASRPTEGKSSLVRADLADGSHVLIEVTRVADADPAASEDAARTAARQQLAAALGAEETRAFVAALRAATTVEIEESRLR
jgi:peptidyl-prolyl cis-trans isomerase D